MAEAREEAQSLSSKEAVNDVLDGIRDLYEDLDSFTSDLRLKLKLAVGLMQDLKPAIETFDALADAKLPAKISQAVDAESRQRCL